MLQSLRSGAHSIVMKIILFGFLIMAMLGLAVMDVQGMFRGGVSDGAVARIGRGKISAVQFDRTFTAHIRRQDIPQALAVQMGLPMQVLMQEINGRLFNMATHDLGFIIDDAKAAQEVRKLLAPLVREGMTEQQALERLLISTGMSEEGLVQTIKAEMGTNTVLRLLSSGARPPRQMIEDAIAYRYETRRGDYFRVAAAEKAAEPSDDELKAYYDTMAAAFALPEYRTVSILRLDHAALGAAQQVTDEELQKHYDAHKAEYGTPETRRVSQLVVRDEAEAKAAFDVALKEKKLNGGAVKSAKNATFLPADDYAEAEMPVETASSAFAAKAGEILPPVRSPLGWHILHVEKIAPGTVKSLAEMKPELLRELAAEKSAEALYDKANEIDDIIAGGGRLAEVARDFGLRPRVIEKVDARGLNPEGKPAADLPELKDVVEQAFRLEKGGAGQLIETRDGAFLIAGVDDIQPAQNRPLAEVRVKVLEQWRQERGTEARSAQVAAIMERLKLGESFDAIAKSFGKSPAQTKYFSRADDPEKAGIDRGILPALFSLDKAGSATVFADDDGAVVVRFADRRMDKPAQQAKEDTEALQNLLQRTLANDILAQYRAHLAEKHDVTVNEAALADLFRAKDEEG